MKRIGWAVTASGPALLVAMEVSPTITAAAHSTSKILEFSTGIFWIDLAPLLLVGLLIAWGVWSERKAIHGWLRGINWCAQLRRFRRKITVRNVRFAGVFLGVAALIVTLMKLIEWRYGGAGVIAILLFWLGSVVRALKPRSSVRAQRLTGLAAAIAGPRRSHLRAEWTAILSSGADPDVLLPPSEQRRLARGFVLAAFKMRLHDLVAPLWHPVDWLLAKDSRTNGFIATVVGGQAIYIVDDGGISALVAEVWEPCGILGAGLYVLARWLRRVRGIELATASPPSQD